MIKDISVNLEGKNLSELQKILKQLKLYKDLTKKLWNRWKNLFDFIVNGKSLYKVEYYSSISEQEALEEAKVAYKKAFWEDIDTKNIVLKKKANLEWGIRVFKNDELLDLSFNKIEKLIKN